MCKKIIRIAAIGWGLMQTACATTSNTHGSAILPIRRVVMYQNGIGYFERRGHIAGDNLALQVRPSQINDMLKSLTLVDANDGRAVSVSLPLEKSAGDALADLPEQVRGAGGILSVLQVFRGARISVHGGQGTASGRVVGVEPLPIVEGETQGTSYRLTLKGQDGVLIVYNVDEIRRIVLDDATLDIGLEKSLDIALDEGQWKPISLSIKLVGDSPHDLIVSYILEMPLWKPAYRLLLDKNDSPLLQGWAVVDNVSGEDWKNVQLSLVAGTPTSFVYDLHAPQFIKRVDLTPRQQRTAAAPVIEHVGTRQLGAQAGAALGAPESLNMAAPRAASKASRARSKRAEDTDELMAPDEEAYARPLSQSLENQAQANVASTSFGALFRYDLQDPVDVPDRSSTLVSIVNKRVAGGEAVLFRPEMGGQNSDVNPYRVAVFTNNTGFTLEKGPVSVYSGDTFAGEAFVERMEKNTTAFLTFAIDGNVTMRYSDASTEENFTLVKIVNGILETQALSVSRAVHKINNRNSDPITAYIKAPKRSIQWNLRNAPKGTIETADAFFLPVSVASNQSAELPIEWTTKIQKQISIDSDNATQAIKTYLGSGKVSAPVSSQLNEILRIKTRISAIANEENELAKQSRTLEQDQERVRNNINILRKTNSNKQLVESLSEKLATQEEALGKLSARRVRLSEERAEINGKLNVLISQVTLEELR